jgi:tripartite-type tricarboxylate transporter receptor subunit TctC
MAELVAAARAAPGRFNFGSYGNSSQPHLCFGAVMARERIEMVHVPYRGLTPAVLATVAGEVQMTLAGIASGAEHIRAGTLRALAVGRPQRFAALPDVPTLEEAGFADIDPRTWFGAFAPAATPPLSASVRLLDANRVWPSVGVRSEMATRPTGASLTLLTALVDALLTASGVPCESV